MFFRLSFPLASRFCYGLTTSHSKSLGRCYSSMKDIPNPSIVVSQDGSTIVCWHPKKDFPYEHTKPLPRVEHELKEADSVLNIQTRMLQDQHKDSGPSDAQLMEMFHTTKHVWQYRPRRRYSKPNPPKDREGI